MPGAHAGFSGLRGSLSCFLRCCAPFVHRKGLHVFAERSNDLQLIVQRVVACLNLEPGLYCLPASLAVSPA